MFNESDKNLGNLKKKELIELINQKNTRIKELKSERSKDRLLKNFSVIISVVLGIVLIFSHILPTMADIEVKNGKDIELTSENDGIWTIEIWSGFLSRALNIPNEKISLRVSFRSDVKIDYDNIGCNPTPDKIKKEETNEIEYCWDILPGGNNRIKVTFPVSSSPNLIGKTWSSVQVSTSNGLKHSH